MRLFLGLRFAFHYSIVIINGMLKYLIVAKKSGQSLEVHLCYGIEFGLAGISVR